MVPPSHHNALQVDDVPDSFGLSGESDEWMDRLREAEAPATLGCIGPYELIEEVSRGGQGIVYRARQPGTKREIVVKRLLAGSFATPAMLRRFEHEVELAASLSHPNIVTVFGIEIIDGQPLLAMEWIDGVPINEWAARGESGRRSPKQIASMMHDVCDAVRHAHQHGVIHRDLKPTNIFVDQSGVPRVLDFGLARPIGTEGESGRTVTLTEQFVGTPAYASPEHLRSGTTAIDVRADVYSLGLVLYNALTGTLPYDVSGDLPDVFHRIEHAEPIRPSTVTPHLDREIEAIVLKAIAKEKERRYQSAADFAADLGCYLRHEPISARPPNAVDQIRKFAVRNKALVGTGMAVALTLVLGIAGTSVGLVRARSAEADARREAQNATAVNEFLQEMLASADPGRDGRNVKVAEVLDAAAKKVERSFRDQPEVKASLQRTIGSTYMALGLYEDADSHLEGAWSLHLRLLGDEHRETLRSKASVAELVGSQGQPKEAEAIAREVFETSRRVLGERDLDTIVSRNHLAWRLRDLGRQEEAEAILQETLAICREELGDDHLETVGTMQSLGAVLDQQGRWDESIELLRQALEAVRRVNGEDDVSYLTTMSSLGSALRHRGNYDEAESLLRQVYEGRTRLLGPEHRNALRTANSLALLCYKRGKFGEAEVLHRQTLAARQTVLGEDHPNTLTSMNNLAQTLRKQDKLLEAEALYRRALEGRARVHGPFHVRTLNSTSGLSNVLTELGRWEEAERLQLELLETALRELGERHWLSAGTMDALARNLKHQKRWTESEALYVQALDLRRRIYGAEHPSTILTLGNLAELLQDAGRPEEAEELFLEVLTLQRRALRPGHPQLARTLSSLALLLRGRGDCERAEPLLREVLEIGRTEHGDQHWRSAHARTRLGDCLTCMQRYEEAEEMLLEGFEQLKTTLGDDDERTASAAQLLVTLYEQMGDLQKAADIRAGLAASPPAPKSSTD
ncbi:MAG: serine/threonine protein kinase [Phycisphaerales bacterium]|nr:MAG: serine/threonine protein kinase [Phycisphaerales bacterium]